MAGAFGEDVGLHYNDEESQNDNSLNNNVEELTSVQKEADKKIVTNQSNKISKSIKKRFIPVLTTMGSVAVPILVIVGILLVVIIGAVAIFSALGLIRFEDAENDDRNAQFGVKGADFYGTRVVYKDGEQARIELVESYASLVDRVVLAIEDTEIEDATLDVTLVLPAEDYNYNNIEAYQTNFPNHYELVNSIAETVHEYDSVDDQITPAALVELLDNIAHFGFSADMIEPIATKVKDYLNNNGLVLSVPDDNSASSSVADSSFVNAAVDSVVTADLAIQLEKYFIKDYIFQTEEEMMSNIVNENYVTMIFMANKEVEFNHFSFLIADIDEDFSMKVVGDSDISFTKSEFSNVDGEITWLFKSGENLTLTASEYSSLGDLDLSESKSLYDIASASEDNTQYIEPDADGIYSYLKEGVRVEFESNVEFNFVEYETLWE